MTKQHGDLVRCGCYPRKMNGSMVSCDRCGDTMVRRVCMERDCQEFGCSFDYCYVPEGAARKYLRQRRPTMTDALKKLIEAVEAGRSPTWIQVIGAIGLHPDNRHLRFYEAYKGSLDATKKLHEALLPGWTWCTADDAHNERWFVVGDRIHFETEECYAGNPARAWLLAILKAKLAQEEDKQ